MSFKTIFSVFLIFFLAFSCKTKREIVNQIDSVYIQRFIPIKLPADSAALKALLVCNAQGRVVMHQLNIESSDNARLTFLLDSLGNLEVKTVVDHDTIYLKSDSVRITSTITKWEYIEKQLGRWDSFILRFGNWMFGALSAIIISLAIFLVFKAKKVLGF